jgi:hypothetical protein
MKIFFGKMYQMVCLVSHTVKSCIPLVSSLLIAVDMAVMQVAAERIHRIEKFQRKYP